MGPNAIRLIQMPDPYARRHSVWGTDLSVGRRRTNGAQNERVERALRAFERGLGDSKDKHFCNPDCHAGSVQGRGNRRQGRRRLRCACGRRQIIPMARPELEAWAPQSPREAC